MKGLSVTTPPLKELFPISSIYINVSTTNPGTIFGGTWEQIKDKFLLCSGNTYSNGSTGGSASHIHTTQGHTLTIDEMPKHNHTTQSLGTTNSQADAENRNNWCALRSVTLSDVIPELVGYTNDTGNGTSHSHGDTTSTSSLPPYLAVTVWKHIA